MDAISAFFITFLTSGIVSTGLPQPPVMLTTIQQLNYKDTLSQSVLLKQPPATYALPETQFVSQTYNNCGPAALSMVLSSYDKKIDQQELAMLMRPYNNPSGGIDDKSVSPIEFVETAKHYGFEAIHRPNGDVNLLKQLIANDIPVVIRTWLNPTEDIGHFRIIKGYNDHDEMLLQDDSYQGNNLSYSYSTVSEMWKPFNYSYILVYPKEKQAIVEAIIGLNINEQTAYQNALKRAESELKIDSNDHYAGFNLATALYHLGEYKKSVAAYEKTRSALPDRILWYQLEPLYAYQKVHKYDLIFEITEAIINNGNPAYSELYYMRGEIYLARGDVETARSEFEKAVYYNNKFEPAQKALSKI